MLLKTFPFLLLFCYLPLGTMAQYSLQLWAKDTTQSALDKLLGQQDASWPDSASAAEALRVQLRKLHSTAFLEATAERLRVEGNSLMADIRLGPAYRWLALSNGNVPPQILDGAGYRERLYRGKPFQFAQLRKLQEALLDYAENHGYPFAEVWLDSIAIQDGQVEAQIFMERGRLILVEELALKGDAKISAPFMESYLGIAAGQPYNNRKVLRIRNRVQELPFLSLSSDPLVTFIEDQATIALPLRQKRASRFDFVLGVLPQNEAGQQDNDRRILITGTFNGELQNQFGQGERIYVAFEQLRPETQQLDLAFNYPYFLGLPFGLDFSLDLYKRDTSYLDLETDVGVQYLFEGGNYLKAFWNNRASTLLTINEARLQLQERLPDNLDVRNAYFGLEYLFQRLDYRFNPRKGWRVFLRGGAGTKRIERNNRVLELGYGELYDTLALRSFQYKLSGQLEGYVPILSRATVKGSLSGGALFSEAPVYFNEQFRIGGNQVLRGFDEESVFATRYALATLEYRLLIGQNSYIYVFGDAAYVEDVTVTRDNRDWPYGFGAGISFETAAGLFGVSLAYGKRLGNPLDFSAPKVHFGYISLFN